MLALQTQTSLNNVPMDNATNLTPLLFVPLPNKDTKIIHEGICIEKNKLFISFTTSSPYDDKLFKIPVLISFVNDNDLNNYHKSNKQILKAKKIKNKLIVPKQLRTPFHLFCRSSEDENRNNLKFMHSKWKSLSEEEKLPYIEKSKSDKQRFDEEYKEYLNQYLNLIYKNSITKDEKESTVANLLKLNEKYDRRFIVKEISNMISIRMFLKKNKSRLLKNVIQRNKIVEKRNVFILEKSKNLK